jgi:hypothetical protein
MSSRLTPLVSGMKNQTEAIPTVRRTAKIIQVSHSQFSSMGSSMGSEESNSNIIKPVA